MALKSEQYCLPIQSPYLFQRRVTWDNNNTRPPTGSARGASTTDFVECTTNKNRKLVAIQLHVKFHICLFLWQLFRSSGASRVTTRLLFLTVMKSFWSTESKSKEEGETQHELCRRAASNGDNDRKDGRERGNDMQPEVAGRPQHIAQWEWGMSLALLQDSQLKQSQITLNRATIKGENKNTSMHRHRPSWGMGSVFSCTSTHWILYKLLQ